MRKGGLYDCLVCSAFIVFAMDSQWFRFPVRDDVSDWSFKREIGAGIVNFLAAGYIVAVNPEILSQAGMPREALISATCYSTAIACILMALWAKVPVMLAPGMGLNAFFAFTLCLGDGVPWRVALGIVFLSGVLFIGLSYWGLRDRVLYAVPKSLRLGILVGIGLFLTFIGFRNMGLIVYNPSTLVSVGEITPQVGVALVGLLAVITLEYYRVPGGILITIIAVTATAVLLGWVAAPSVWVGSPPSISPLALELDVLSALKPLYWVPIFIFLYVDLFDSMGSLTAVSYQAGLNRGEIIPGLNKMFMADATGTAIGAVLGTSTVTAYVESCAGVASGGRTGWTAIFTGLLFLVAPMFYGLITIVPPYATSVALILVGVYMMRHVGEINFSRWEEAVPAFFTITLMPLTYSIATGICFGILGHIAIVIVGRRWSEFNMLLGGMGLVSLLYLIVGIG